MHIEMPKIDFSTKYLLPYSCLLHPPISFHPKRCHNSTSSSIIPLFPSPKNLKRLHSRPNMIVNIPAHSNLPKQPFQTKTKQWGNEAASDSNFLHHFYTSHSNEVKHNKNSPWNHITSNQPPMSHTPANTHTFPGTLA